jgi:hypothetical protein
MVLMDEDDHTIGVELDGLQAAVLRGICIAPPHLLQALQQRQQQRCTMLRTSGHDTALGGERLEAVEMPVLEAVEFSHG